MWGYLPPSHPAHSGGVCLWGDLLRVAFVASDNQGGGRVRSYWPAEALRARGWHATASTNHPRLGDADIVVIHRPFDPHSLSWVHTHRNAGSVVLVDEDDLVHDVPDTNPRRPSPAMLARHLAAIEAADGLTVTTPALAQRYGPHARRTWVVPNRLPRWSSAIRRHRMRDDHSIRVGWQGIVLTHRHDLDWLAPHARRALTGATFTLVGDPHALRVLRLNHHPHEVHTFQLTAEGLYRTMARADIGMVPLDHRPFNVAKSWLKALEYMTLGIPVVATDLPEQRRLIDNGIDGYLVETSEQFADRVAQLVANPELRAHMGQVAKAKTRRLFLEDHIDEWETVLTEAMGGVGASESLEELQA